MNDIKAMIRKMFIGRLNRIEFFWRTLIAFILPFAMVMMFAIPTGLMLGSTGGSQAILKGIGGFLGYLVGGIIGIGIIIFCWGCAIRRMRDILSLRPDREVYFVVVATTIIGMIIPFLGIVNFCIFQFLPSDFSETDFYKENIGPGIEKATDKVVSFFTTNNKA